jgi:hypothetical protein
MFFLLLNFFLMLQSPLPIDDLQTPFEKGNGNQTCTYEECINWYENLDKQFDEVKLLTYGATSVGKPLHVVVISKDKIFDPEAIRKSNRRIYLVNNGIHPGEPDGIDASMMFARDVLTKKELKGILDHVVIIIIPVYNVSGMLNRGAAGRANQNGPEEYGFRGTSQNYDLNRDFVKCDSREAQTFTQIFREWQPEIFVDTHVSNGADYQYTMTLIPSQPDKLESTLAAYQQQSLLPRLNAAVKESGFEVVTYVNSIEETPDSGLVAFLETPRYSTGYAALFNCIGMMPETHMLKPYRDRVYSTYELIVHVGKIVNSDYELIGMNKKKADEIISSQKKFIIGWKLDELKFEMIPFKGYTASYKPSDVSGLKRLYYDRSAPFEKEVKYYNHYIASESADKPFAYIVPQGWEQVIERLKLNKVEMKPLSRDTVMEVQVYYIEDYKTATHAYEGHYIHSSVKVRSEMQRIAFYKGDYIIHTNQASNRYIVEMLEPAGTDSYFAWNFFDPILMQKEYFSDYVWEDKAAELLGKDEALNKAFQEKKNSDTAFAKDGNAQLNFIYTHSPDFEKSFNRYPVARVLTAVKFPE